jgi:hypothetical protein
VASLSLSMAVKLSSGTGVVDEEVMMAKWIEDHIWVLGRQGEYRQREAGCLLTEAVRESSAALALGGISGRLN